jgi:hypothetical protein
MAAFTTIATGIGLATTAGTTIASFAQAADQNRKMKQAEQAAAKAMDSARKRLEVNYYEQLGIQREPYELARRELLSQGALATEALKEGDARSLAAGVGRVQLAQQAGQEKVATAQQQEQATLKKLITGEETRLADIGSQLYLQEAIGIGSQLYLQEAIGAQEAAADAQKAGAQALQQGFAGVTRLGAQLAILPQLYEKTDSAKAFNQFDRRFNKSFGKSSQEFVSGINPETMTLTTDQKKILKQAGSIGGMSALQYQDFMGGFSPEYLNSLEASAGVLATDAGIFDTNLRFSKFGGGRFVPDNTIFNPGFDYLSVFGE